MIADTKQQRWNKKYRDKDFTKGTPAFVLEAGSHLLDDSGTALDVASGFGANAIFLAHHNYQVTAVDYSSVALDKLAAFADKEKLSINTQCTDLESVSDLGLEKYDVIVGSYYLQRNLFPVLFKALKPGGLFYYQTFSGDAINGGPENPAFRLKKGELLTLCREHSILYYREDKGRCSGACCFNDEAMIVVSKVT